MTMPTCMLQWLTDYVLFLHHTKFENMLRKSLDVLQQTHQHAFTITNASTLTGLQATSLPVPVPVWTLQNMYVHAVLHACVTLWEG